MAENSLRMNSKSYAKNQRLRGSCPLLIIHNRMGLRNGRTKPSWKLQKPCSMIKIFLCIFGLKLPEQWYVQNRTPHRVLENKTPEEVFSGKKPEVIHLRIFGCLVYIHIPKEKRTKLDPQERRVYLWDTLKARRLIEYISQDTRRLTSARM